MMLSIFYVFIGHLYIFFGQMSIQTLPILKLVICLFTVLFLFFFFRFHFFFNIPVNNVVVVSGGQQRDSVIHIHVTILPQMPFRIQAAT